VPETAEFLRPQNPDSLAPSRARLLWDANQIILQLPAVTRDRLPARWHVNDLSQEAASTPDRFVVNGRAFCNPLRLTLTRNSSDKGETKRLTGLDPWGLFDLENGGTLVNPDRDELPLKRYQIVSKSPITIHSHKGFDVEDRPNQEIELPDGSHCFLTPLWPTGRAAKLWLREEGATRKIQFRPHAKIEAQFFVGSGAKAAFFTRMDDGRIKIEAWPVLCIAIPRGYFNDDKGTLDKTFEVLIDEKSADGQWEQCRGHEEEDRSLYQWNWTRKSCPVMEIKPSRVSSFQDIPKLVDFPTLDGDRTLSIRSPQFRQEYKVCKDTEKPGIAKSWSKIPGAALPLFLLCQATDGMKWNLLLLAKAVIAPDAPLSPSLLRKCEKYGILQQRGVRWQIRESRAVIKHVEKSCQIDYCGDPSILWGLYCHMDCQRSLTLPGIEVICEGGEAPYLRMVWPWRFHNLLVRYFENHDVITGDVLWTH
jgi:hypothetical protein